MVFSQKMPAGGSQALADGHPFMQEEMIKPPREGRRKQVRHRASSRDHGCSAAFDELLRQVEVFAQRVSATCCLACVEKDQRLALEPAFSMDERVGLKPDDVCVSLAGLFVGLFVYQCDL